MIAKIKHSNEGVASQIHHVFQNAYKIEAALIGVECFPPLQRSIVDIVNSTTEFYGFKDKDVLAAVVEIAIDSEYADIHSLTVDPAYFRKGIAGQLIAYVLALPDVGYAVVETAVVNGPAIELYKKYGFVEFRRWTPSHGIEKVAMSTQQA